MNVLKTLIDNLKKTKAVAEKNLEEIPTFVQGSWAVAINEAKSKMASLKEEYKTALGQNSVAIFLNGPKDKVAEFTQLLKDWDDQGITVDAAALYERLATGVEATLSDREVQGLEWGVAQTHKFHIGIQEVMHEVGIKELPMPDRDQRPFVATHEDIVAHVRQLTRGATGDMLNKLYLQEQILAQGLIRYIQDVAVVVVLNARDEEALNISALFGKGVTTVTLSADDVIDEEFLKKTYQQVNSKLKVSKKPDTKAEAPVNEEVGPHPESTTETSTTAKPKVKRIRRTNAKENPSE